MGERCGDGAGGHDGRIVSLTAMAETLTLPGFVNAHSHTFQRALRGRAGGEDFWAWRELMLAEAERQTPRARAQLYAETYREMRARGLHGGRRVPLPRARRGARRSRSGGRGRGRARRSCSPPTRAAGCRACGRSRSRSTSRQLESLRADGDPRRRRPPLRPRLPARLARGARPLRGAEGLPLHVHASEQPREVEECLAEHGCRPIELLARTGCLGAARRRSCTRRTPTAPSSTCSRRAGATVCACPTTEADLGDGFLPAARIDHRRIALCIGSDSNVRIDPLEELRELEGIARRQTGTRGVFSTERLLCFGADEGGRSLGLETLAGDRDRPRAPVAAGRRPRGRVRRARRRLRRGRRQRQLNVTSSTQTAPRRLAGLDRDPREDRGGRRARELTETRVQPRASRQPAERSTSGAPAASRRRTRRSRAGGCRWPCRSPSARDRRVPPPRAAPSTGATVRAPEPALLARAAARRAGLAVAVARVEVAARTRPGRRQRRPVRRLHRLLEAAVEARVARAGEEPPDRRRGVLLRPVGRKRPNVYSGSFGDTSEIGIAPAAKSSRIQIPGSGRPSRRVAAKHSRR